MVRGLDAFRKYFEAFPDNYVIIGGTACDIIIEGAALAPRATRDIDIILVIEALTPEFARRFWNFIADGAYEQRERSDDERRYYRFQKPAKEDYPYQIELFSKTPDILNLPADGHLTPIPVDEEVSSLSAILMNEEYYEYTLEHSSDDNGVHIANKEALICLKAKAFLDYTQRKAAGEQVDNKNIRKHKGDIFRLGTMLAADDIFELPESIKGDLQEFANTVKNDLPGKELFKDLGLPNIDASAVFTQIMTSFGLNKE